MSKPKSPAKRPLLWRLTLTALLLAAAAWVLAAHWQTVRSSLRVARGASIGWLALSLLAMASTFCTAAGTYSVLALHRLRYGQTLLVEVSAAFVNRLLPSGLGGLGLHGVYLYKRKHTAAEATVVVSMNNLLGMAAHVLLLAGVLAFYPHVLHQFMAGQHVLSRWVGAAAAAALAVIACAVPWVRRRLASFIHHLLASVRKLRARRALSALLLAMLLTACYTFILFSAVHALHLRLGILQVFIVFSLAMLTGTATPTPGGLVGTEAGLVAGFVAYGVSAPLAGAATLLYRLITYWLPLIPGVCALLLARKRRLL